MPAAGAKAKGVPGPPLEGGRSRIRMGHHGNRHPGSNASDSIMSYPMSGTVRGPLWAPRLGASAGIPRPRPSGPRHTGDTPGSGSPPLRGPAAGPGAGATAADASSGRTERPGERGGRCRGRRCRRASSGIGAGAGSGGTAAASPRPGPSRRAGSVCGRTASGQFRGLSRRRGTRRFVSDRSGGGPFLHRRGPDPRVR